MSLLINGNELESRQDINDCSIQFTHLLFFMLPCTVTAQSFYLSTISFLHDNLCVCAAEKINVEIHTLAKEVNVDKIVAFS